MKVKTKDLEDVLLDWAVAKCQNIKVSVRFCKKENEPYKYVWFQTQEYSPSTNDLVWVIYSPSKNWDQAGPIIDREDIHWGFGTKDGNKVVIASKFGHHVKPLLGPTPLIAAMRCFVESRLGDEVEIPEELCK